MVTKPMIMWSNTWSGTWSNTWPTDIIFLEANKPYLHYYQTRHCHSCSKTSIEPTALEARRGHYQLVDRRSKTFTNIAIILIDAIYKEFYECWSSGTLIAKLHLKPIRAWSSFSLTYQLIAVPTPSRCSGWVKEALGYRRGRKWSGKRITGWTQSKNLLLERQYQLLSIDSLSEVDPSQ